jgi:hypothetical protein
MFVCSPAVFGCLLCALLLTAAARTAQAYAPVRATVLHIDGDEIVIDLGHSQISQAQTLVVYRTLEVRHPLSRKLLRDRFVIGELQVVQAGESLSVTRLRGAASHPPAVGDTVELPPSPKPAVALRAPESAPATQATASLTGQSAAAEPAQSDPTAERVLLSYWYASLSQPPAARAQLFDDYLQRSPASAYAPSLQDEIRYLRQLDTVMRRDAAGRGDSEAAARSIEMLPLTAASAGRSVELAARARVPNDLRGLILHVRSLEASGYHSIAMELDARGHARARSPAELVKPPGIAYFIVAVDSEGHGSAALGSPSQPKIAVVRGAVRARVRRERATRVRFSSELVSFDGTSGRDYYLVNEGDFLYRVRHGLLYGVRMGYGNLRGEGGSVEQLDVQRLEPSPAGFSYGFFEIELELHRLFGAAMRGTLGLGRPDDPRSQRDGITGGFQARARIGEAEGPHLMLAGELMPEIGQRAYLALVWEAIERLPMTTEIVVTDQPVNSDELAVRLIFEAGYRFTDRITVSLRPSYQLRTIRHAGPGIGMAATFDW